MVSNTSRMLALSCTPVDKFIDLFLVTCVFHIPSEFGGVTLEFLVERKRADCEPATRTHLPTKILPPSVVDKRQEVLLAVP